MSIRTTSKPSSAEYLFGGGIAYILQGNGMRDLGVVSNFSISSETETVEISNLMNFSATTYREITLETTINVAFDLDNIMEFDNMALFLKGATAVANSEASQYGSGQAGRVSPYNYNAMTVLDLVGPLVGTTTHAKRTYTGATAPLDRWETLTGFELMENDEASGDNQAEFQDLVFFDLDSTTAGLTRYTAPAAPTGPYTEPDPGAQVQVWYKATGGSTFTQAVYGTDYELDFRAGRILMKTGGNLSTSLNTIEVVVLARTGASPATSAGRDLIKGFTQSDYQGELIFISENAQRNGRKTLFRFPNITLRPTGTLDLIGDDFASVSFEGTAAQSTDPLLVAVGASTLLVADLG